MNLHTKQMRCIRCGGTFKVGEMSSWRIYRWFRLGSSNRHCTRCDALATYLADGGSVDSEAVPASPLTENPYSIANAEPSAEDLDSVPIKSSCEWVASNATGSTAIFVLVTAPHLFFLLAYGIVHLHKDLVPEWAADLIQGAFKTFTEPILLILILAVLVIGCAATGAAYWIGEKALWSECLVVRRNAAQSLLNAIRTLASTKSEDGT